MKDKKSRPPMTTPMQWGIEHQSAAWTTRDLSIQPQLQYIHIFYDLYMYRRSPHYVHFRDRKKIALQKKIT